MLFCVWKERWGINEVNKLVNPLAHIHTLGTTRVTFLIRIFYSKKGGESVKDAKKHGKKLDQCMSA